MYVVAPSVAPWPVELCVQTPCGPLRDPLGALLPCQKGCFWGGGGVNVIPKPAPCSFGLKEAQVQIKACKIKKSRESGTFGHIPQVLLSQDVCMSHCLEIQVARCPPDTAALKLLTPAGRARGRGLLFSPEVAGR